MIQFNAILRILITFIYGAIDDLYQKKRVFSIGSYNNYGNVGIVGIVRYCKVL